MRVAPADDSLSSLRLFPELFPNDMNTFRLLALAGFLPGTFLPSSSAFAQGTLTPPGPPAPTMKTLDQIEPRTPITSLPFNITSSGSYYFTRNLHFTAESGDAITVSASDVTIDLMGFTLSSAAAVTGNGIFLGTAERCTVKNGIIVGTTTVAITGARPDRTWKVNPGGFENGVGAQLQGGRGTRFLELTVGNCRNDGIWASQLQDSMAERCVARQNGGRGISATIVTNSVATSNGEAGISAATVAGCLAKDNGSAGIDTGRGGVATNCSASGNGGTFGIFAHSALNCLASENKQTGIYGHTVTGCTAELNGGRGISGQTVVDSISLRNNGDGIEGDNVKGCRADENKGAGISATVHDGGAGASIQDCVASYNTRHGIVTTGAAKIINNTATENGFEGDGAGIRVSGQKCRIDSNHVADNDRGIEVTGTRNLIVRNSSRSNGQNYVIVAGNRIARIVVPALNTANITGANSGSSDGFTDVDPWANFTF